MSGYPTGKAWVESGVANHRMLEDLVRELAIGVRVTGLRAVVNVNIATPPAWADERAEGPLFAGQRPPLDPLRKREAAHALVDAIRADGTLRSQCVSIGI